MQMAAQGCDSEEKAVSLSDQLRRHSSHFCSMVELIPAKYYVVKEEVETEPGAGDSKYWVNKNKRQKESVKDLTKKAKRLKLDPGSQKTVADLQAEKHQREKREAEDSCDEVEDSGDVPRISVEKVQSTSLNDLQERLKEKIEGLRCKRNAPSEGASNEASALKKQKRLKKKQKKKELRHKKKLIDQKGATGFKEEKAESIDGKEKGRIIFSKFDFNTPNKEETKGIGKMGKKKDYKRLLARAEATEKKLEELKKRDERRGEELEKKVRWQKALDMARGAKLKDDPKLLKKSLKRQEKRKLKSSKQWEERKEAEQLAMEKRQEKRKKNIQERAQKTKESKIKRRAKRVGRIKPGF